MVEGTEGPQLSTTTSSATDKDSKMTKFLRNEDLNLQEAISYIGTTYAQHYVGKTDIQTIDVWESLGSLESTSRDTAIKYLMRYGKKDGKNRKDLLKAIHYIALMLYVLDKEQYNEQVIHDDDCV